MNVFTFTVESFGLIPLKILDDLARNELRYAGKDHSCLEQLKIVALTPKRAYQALDNQV